MGPKVTLASMPWTSIDEPSLGLGILKSQLSSAGIESSVNHLNLFLLDYIKPATYGWIGNTFALNDFMFSGILDPGLTTTQDRLLREISRSFVQRELLDREQYPSEKAIYDMFIELREEVVPAYLEKCLALLDLNESCLVGFTCLFDQTIASVALAKLIKDAHPEITIAFGGYALEGVVGAQVLRSFPWIDCIARGEGEPIIVDLARAAEEGRGFHRVPNLLYQKQGEKFPVASVSHAATIDMNDSPIPDYSDFFQDVATLAETAAVEIGVATLPVETSRGCWWGQTKHCVFCGIDEVSMKYRNKSSDTTMEMLETLSDRYGIRSFRFNDYILPIGYFKDLLPRLAGGQFDYELWCETKANLSHDKIRLLRDAGFIGIQPGIESLSSSLLRHMDKGVSATQNVQTLLLGQRYGITVHFNLIYGFPFDTEDVYRQQLEKIPLLYHIRPPESVVRVQITRFAPLQVDPARFGNPNKPVYHPNYDIIFSEQFLAHHDFDLNQYCYYFDGRAEESEILELLYESLLVQTEHWRKIHERRTVRFNFITDKNGIRFEDTRYDSVVAKYSFGPEHAKIYEYCAEESRTLKSIRDKFESTMAIEVVESVLDELVASRCTWVDGGRYLSLATPETENVEKMRGGVSHLVVEVNTQPQSEIENVSYFR